MQVVQSLQNLFASLFDDLQLGRLELPQVVSEASSGDHFSDQVYFLLLAVVPSLDCVDYVVML